MLFLLHILRRAIPHCSISLNLNVLYSCSFPKLRGIQWSSKKIFCFWSLETEPVAWSKPKSPSSFPLNFLFLQLSLIQIFQDTLHGTSTTDSLLSSKYAVSSPSRASSPSWLQKGRLACPQWLSPSLSETPKWGLECLRDWVAPWGTLQRFFGNALRLKSKSWGRACRCCEV